MSPPSDVLPLPMACLLAVAIAIASATSGCSSGGDGRQQVEGQVTIDGQPLEEGYITFRPQGEGQPGGSAIAKGQFRIPAGKGLFAGMYNVEIKGMRPTGETYVDSESGKTEQELEQFVPAQYNTRTTLTAEVKTGSANDFEFPLLSNP